jgi:hypothetical protein
VAALGDVVQGYNAEDRGQHDCRDGDGDEYGHVGLPTGMAARRAFCP